MKVFEVVEGYLELKKLQDKIERHIDDSKNEGHTAITQSDLIDIRFMLRKYYDLYIDKEVIYKKTGDLQGK